MCGVDWRFFTSQVAEANFEAAIRGVQALGLQGAAILAPFQQAVIPFLDTVTESAHSLQRVTIARLDGHSWLGDNFFGSAIWQTIQSRVARERGLHASMASELSEDSLEPVGALLVGKRVSPQSDTLEKCLRINQPDAWQLHRFDSENAEQSISATQRFGALIIENDIENSQLKSLLQWSWVASPVVIHLDAAAPQARKNQREELAVRGFQRVEQVEWMAHEAVADFAFLTGVTPPLDSVRESLEEYLQW
jgi:shikimate dehydrogenase